MTGNPNYGLAEKFAVVCPQTDFASRTNSYDLCSKEGRVRLAYDSLAYDVGNDIELLEHINNPAKPNRKQWLNYYAWTEYTLDEISDGIPLKRLTNCF